MRYLPPTLALLALVLPARAADVSLSIDTGRSADNAFTLAGRDALQQLIVTSRTADGKLRDHTHEATYETTPPDVVKVDKSGLVQPLKEGRATIRARLAGAMAETTVTVKRLTNDVPVSFANQVVPVFTKFGCNAGGCHGKASGQNGFKLSLLGFEPAEDYEYLVKEARGRRVLPTSPSQSLLMQKATGAVPHGGGKKLSEESPFYAVLRRWIEQGTPPGRRDDPTVTRIEVFPKDRVLPRDGRQQLAVVAHYSDGSTSDVTRMAQFELNYVDLAEVTNTGVVTTKQLAGSAAIMARFQSHVDVFRASVSLGLEVTKLPPARSFIDELVFKQLKQLGLPPSEPCDDATFLRRATIDLAGRLPTPEEAKAFTANGSADKYEKLVDRLLDSDDHADYFANKWSAVLRNRRRTLQDDPKPTAAFHAWIRESIQTNKPYDQFVREVVTATGEEVTVPATVWYREVQEASAQVEDVAQLFLGQRIGCAKCHHHPFEKWSQQDYFGMVAFFTRVEVKDPPAPKPKKKGDPVEPKPPLTVSLKGGKAQATNPRTNKPVPPTGLGGEPMNLGADEDPRAKLAEWMTDPKNPFFAKALVNRYWKHFLGRGLVDPEDDLRVTNPPSNPKLLEALAKSFAESKYDLKALARTVCTSSVYRLSAMPNEHNAGDRQNFSRYLPKRLHAEVLLDAIDTVTASKTNFKGAPAGTRAVQLPDNLFESYFLSVFGRPDAGSACECERSGDASLAQALHMFNSQEILDKVSGGKGRAAALAKDKRPHEDKLRELYLIALSREPSADEVQTLRGHLEKKGNPQQAYEDIVWALLNTKEFLFNNFFFSREPPVSGRAGRGRSPEARG
jgi:hypothetical protein